MQYNGTQQLFNIQGVDVPCFSIMAEVPEMDNDLDGMESKVKKRFLVLFFEDRNMVKMSLASNESEVCKFGHSFLNQHFPHFVQ